MKTRRPARAGAGCFHSSIPPFLTFSILRNLIAETKADQERNPMSERQMLKETGRLTRYGAERAKALGIKPRDIGRLVHERRNARKA